MWVKYQISLVKEILDTYAKDLTSILETTYFKLEELTLGEHFNPVNNTKLQL